MLELDLTPAEEPRMGWLGRLFGVFLAGTCQPISMASAIEPHEITLFRCELISEARLLDDGRFEDPKYRSPIFQSFTPVIIDTKTGIVRLGPEGQVFYYNVVQVADIGNDWILDRTTRNNTKTPTIPNIYYDIVRIRTWKDPILIMMFEQDGVMSGTCQKVS